MAQRLKTDWILFLAVLTMVCFGLVMVYSASSSIAQLKFHWDSTHFFVRQLGWAVVSFLILLYCMKRDYRTWNAPKYAFTGLGVVVLLLLVVYVTDSGSHRWLRGGPLSLQPSELAKPALALFLAFFLCGRRGSWNRHCSGTDYIYCHLCGRSQSALSGGLRIVGLDTGGCICRHEAL